MENTGQGWQGWEGWLFGCRATCLESVKEKAGERAALAYLTGNPDDFPSSMPRNSAVERQIPAFLSPAFSLTDSSARSKTSEKPSLPPLPSLSHIPHSWLIHIAVSLFTGDFRTGPSVWLRTYGSFFRGEDHAQQVLSCRLFVPPDESIHFHRFPPEGAEPVRSFGG